MTALVVRTRSAAETAALGERIGRQLRAGDVVGLEGELGAGKTTFAQGIARGLAVTSHVSSPTFTLVREYRGRVPVYHVDLYRIEREEEVADLALEEVVGGEGVAVIEWPERAPRVLPEARLRVRIAFDGDDERTITVEASGPRHRDLVRGLAEPAP